MTTSNQSAPRAQRRRRLFMHYVRGSLIMVCSFAGLAIALALMT